MIVDIQHMADFQSGIQDAVISGMRIAQNAQVGPQQTLQLIAQEVVHAVMMADLNLNELQAWYRQDLEPDSPDCECPTCR